LKTSIKKYFFSIHLPCHYMSQPGHSSVGVLAPGDLAGHDFIIFSYLRRSSSCLFPSRLLLSILKINLGIGDEQSSRVARGRGGQSR